MKQDEESKSVKPEQEGPPFYDLETGEYLGGFKSKKEAKDYFLSIGMSEEDYDWLEANKDNLFNEDGVGETKWNLRNASVNGSVNGT